MACACSSDLLSRLEISRTACRWSPSLWPTPLSPALLRLLLATGAGETVVSRSRSLWDAHLSAHGLKSAFGDPDLFVGQGPNKEPLLIMTRTVLLPGSDRVFTLVMARTAAP